MPVQTLTVTPSDDDLRLDRWFKKHFPEISHGRLQKWLRTGQVRLDGGRAKSGSRVKQGQLVRVPPLGDAKRDARPKKPAPAVDAGRADDLRSRVIYTDDDVLIIDKPAGLSVQGGSGVSEHLDGYLDELRFGVGERPRLVHRLDKDTSGVLVLARHAKAARWLTAAFRQRDTRKLYWSVVAGVPEMPSGMIDAPLEKRHVGAGEKMVVVERGAGQTAKTGYRIVAQAGNVAAWLAMEPLTGRTHQLRVHAAEVLGTPILGDGKYGGAAAFIDTGADTEGLHLHARGLIIRKPNGMLIEAYAEPPKHVLTTLRYFGFYESQAEAGFIEQ